MTKQELIDKCLQLRNELSGIFQRYELRAIAAATAEDMLNARREENRILLETLARHKREWDAFAGELEPMAHEGAAVMLPMGGMSA